MRTIEKVHNITLGQMISDMQNAMEFASRRNALASVVKFANFYNLLGDLEDYYIELQKTDNKLIEEDNGLPF